MVFLSFGIINSIFYTLLLLILNTSTTILFESKNLFEVFGILVKVNKLI